MSYVLRKTTEADKQYFIDHDVWDPFGYDKPAFYSYMVENLEEDVKATTLGGSGIMEEDGTEITDMCKYWAVVWKGKRYLVELYVCRKCIDNKFSQCSDDDFFEMIYKIKTVRSLRCTEEEKTEFIEVCKKSLTALDNWGHIFSTCTGVSFIDEKVKWV